jgi:hypothetical protein
VSRTFKRVPMDFAWPIGQLWRGYVNPHEDLAVECLDCRNGHDRVGGRPDANAALFHDQWYGLAPFDPKAYGAEPLSPYAPAIWRLASKNVGAPADFYTGNAKRIAREAKKAEACDPADPILVPFPQFDKESAINREARRLYALWRCQWQHHLVQADVEALIAEERLWDLTSTWSKAHGWQPREDGHQPTAAEVNAWSLEGFGHDSFNCGHCIEARCAREGVPYLCGRCHGSGSLWPTPEIEKKCEDWQPTDPPIGDGYQLWENCSEGRPVSPVFPSLDALCAWAADHETTFGAARATAKKWKQLLEEDFVHADDGQGNIYQ